MARRLPVQHVRPVRTVHYVDPAMQSDLIRYGLLNPAEIVRQQQRNTELYLRWKTRQAEIKERDRKFRRFYLGLGATVGLVLLVAVFLGGWLIWQHLAAFGFGAMVIVPVILLLAGGLAVGGHRCITIVQHMH
jgi:sterol desaturase/sphingolipid hydroxylase (fatty acid hydroxylase superfamily)